MDAEQLSAVEEIKRVKYRFMRCLDTKVLDELATCFTEDVTMEAASGKFSAVGRSEVCELLAQVVPGFRSSHIASQPEIDLMGDRAEAWWKLDDVIITESTVTTGGGFYRDRYELREGQWRISHTGFIRLYEWTVDRVDGALRSIDAPAWADVARSDNPAWFPPGAGSQ